MIPYNPYDPYNPNYRFRGISPPRNDREYPRAGWYPDEYRSVSPMPRVREPEFPNFRGATYGHINSHYPRGRGRRNGGFWQGGGAGEWEHWW